MKTTKTTNFLMNCLALSVVYFVVMCFTLSLKCHFLSQIHLFSSFNFSKHSLCLFFPSVVVRRRSSEPLCIIISS